MLSHAVPSAADPDVAWSLLSEPSRWREWSPHIRGAWGLGGPEVEGSALGAVRLLGFLPVPARINLVEKSRARRHWVFSVGPVSVDHSVTRDAEGSTIAISLQAVRPLEALIRVSYWPLAKRSIERLATKAEDERLAEVLPPMDSVPAEHREAALR